MRVNDIGLKSVAFIAVGGDQQEDHLQIRFVGTGFFVSRIASADSSVGHIFLITAKHVALKNASAELVVCVNRKDQTVGGYRIQAGTKWRYHDDLSVDIAVLEMSASILDLDVQWISSDMVLTQEQYDKGAVGIGDEVFSIGLFSRFPGKSLISPVVRIGNISMLPKERVPTKLGDIEAYLIEARSIGGLSGSPVFVRETVGVPTSHGPLYGNGEVRLLGLIHGHWDMPVSATIASSERVNLGLAIVIPAKFIIDIIDKILFPTT